MNDRCQECDRHFGIHAEDCSQHSAAIPLLMEIKQLQARIAKLEKVREALDAACWQFDPDDPDTIACYQALKESEVTGENPQADV